MWLLRLGKVSAALLAAGTGAAGVTIISRGDDAGMVRFGRAAAAVSRLGWHSLD